MNFIGQYNINEDLCDELIEFHKTSPNKAKGKIGYGKIIPEMKASTDVEIEPGANDLVKKYEIELQKCLNAYMIKYVWSTRDHPQFLIREKFNLQHYAPNEGYRRWHYEQYAHGHMLQRHLVFMTFLNTVMDEGFTEFWYQRVMCQPVKGRTLIWPAGWTHTHHGIPSQTEEKYIITGWWSHIDHDKNDERAELAWKEESNV